MQITPQQLINPGIIEYDEKYRKQQETYQKAVKNAQFLTDLQKDNWGILGYSLTQEQLRYGEQLILNEHLRQLKISNQLEAIKPINK